MDLSLYTTGSNVTRGSGKLNKFKSNNTRTRKGKANNNNKNGGKSRGKSPDSQIDYDDMEQDIDIELIDGMFYLSLGNLLVFFQCAGLL